MRTLTGAPRVTIAALLVLAACGTTAEDTDNGTGPTTGASPTTTRSYLAGTPPFAMDRLDCDHEDTTAYTRDQSQPVHGVSVNEALETVSGAVLVEEEGSRAVAIVEHSGRVVETVILSRWPNGSWSVESGASCR